MNMKNDLKYLGSALALMLMMRCLYTMTDMLTATVVDGARLVVCSFAARAFFSALGIALFLRMTGLKLSKLLPVTPSFPRRWVLLMVSAVSTTVAFGLLSSTEKTLFPRAENAGEYVLYFFIYCVFIPVLEEIVFRGVVFRSLRSFSIPGAIASQAALFALCHAQPSQLVYALIGGLFLGTAANESRSLLFPAIMHSLINLVAFTAAAAVESGFSSQIKFFYFVLIIVGLICTIILLFSQKNYRRRVWDMPGFCLKLFTTPMMLFFVLYRAAILIYSLFI